MKTKILLVFAIIAIFSVSAAGTARAAVIATLYGTGTNGTQGLETKDSHFTLISEPALANTTGPFITQATAGFPYPSAWIADPSNAEWISPQKTYTASGAGDPEGDYEYQETFSLAGYNPADTVITGEIATDNTLVSITLDGVTLTNAQLGAGFNYNNVTDNALTAFTISFTNNTFNSGINTLDFTVDNGKGTTGNPTGLLVELSGTANTVVPEPSTVTVYILGLFVLLGFAIRKKLIRI